MYIFRRLTWIDINVVKLITMYVLIMLFSSCLSRYAQLNKYVDCYDICYTCSYLMLIVSPIHNIPYTPLLPHIYPFILAFHILTHFHALTYLSPLFTSYSTFQLVVHLFNTLDLGSWTKRHLSDILTCYLPFPLVIRHFR